MLYVYEFELFKGQQFLLVYPFDFEGGTQGGDEREAAEMAADWLKTEIEYRLMHGLAIPEPTFGHSPQRDGRILIVAIEASRDTVDTVPAHEAAEMLGISRGRVSQMLSAGVLDGFKKGRDAFVTTASIRARLKQTPQAGRPRKTTIK